MADIQVEKLCNLQSNASISRRLLGPVANPEQIPLVTDNPSTNMMFQNPWHEVLEEAVTLDVTLHTLDDEGHPSKLSS